MVLFRRVSTRTRKDPNNPDSPAKEMFLTLPQPQRNAIREKLLLCLSGETVETARHKVGDAVAEIARQYSDDGVFSPPLQRTRARDCNCTC
ncbi:MAG: hypothetical protein INR71_06270 [Terriglobus roseus]|nr:hypothetical protein [Terriglobus roseus]